MIWPCSVNERLRGQPRVQGACATPKSMILGDGVALLPPATRMFEGLRSRWTMPLWCACCTALADLEEQREPPASRPSARWRA